MLSLQTQQDAMGRMTDLIPVSDSSMALILAAGVGKQVTVPAGARNVLFSATGNFWLDSRGPATLPTGDVLNGSAPELNPSGRMVQPGQTLGLVAPAACAVNLCFFG